MVRQKRDVAIIVLRCVIFGCCVSAQQAAFGIEMVTPSKPAAGGYVLAAQADTPDEPQAIVQETKNADAPAEPQAVMQEIKSATRLSGSKQRRRKPKMAGVPTGSPVVAKETKESESQTVARKVEETGTLDKPLAVVQEAKETGTPVKHQAGTQETEEEEAGPFASARPAVTQEAKPVREAKPAKSGKKYGMAPVRWGVRVSETLGLLRETTESGALGSGSSTHERTFTNTQTAEIKASSYIMQPYIAQVSGGIGVVSSASHTNSTTSSGGAGATSSTGTMSLKRDNKLFGNGALALFSKSRFPFSGAFNISDSRANSELTNDDTVSKTLSLNQSYRPVSGPARYSGGYNSNTTNSKLSSPYSLSAWNGNYSTRLGSNQDQPFYANVRHTVSETSELGALRTNILTAQHAYLPQSSLLTLNTTANFTQSAQQSSTGQNEGVKSRFLQANTVASWQPEDEDIPLFVTGTGRVFSSLTDSKGISVASKSLGGDIAATYDASNNLKYSLNANATRSISKGVSDMTTTQSGRASYSSDAIKFENKSTYAWNTFGGASNQTGGNITGTAKTDITGFNPRGLAGAGHTLRGPYELSVFGKNAPLNYTIHQTLSVEQPLSGNANRIASRTSRLLNNASLTSAFGKERLSGAVGVSVTDTKTTGGKNPGHTRLFALQLSGQGRQPIYEGYGAKADASMQATRMQNGQMQTSALGVGTYTKYNIFGVRNLSYSGQLNITVRPSSGANTNANTNNPGVAEYNPVSWDLRQYLSYRIGQNEARLTGYFADQNGVKRASLLLQLRAWRTIGN